jgi:hypothetical protein
VRVIVRIVGCYFCLFSRWREMGEGYLYAVMIGGGKVQEEALYYYAEGVHLWWWLR